MQVRGIGNCTLFYFCFHLLTNTLLGTSGDTNDLFCYNRARVEACQQNKNGTPVLYHILRCNIEKFSLLSAEKLN